GLAAASLAQTTAFTYQGRLNDGSAPANGQYDFEFKAFDALSGGTQYGPTQTLTNVQVTNGIFTVELDFGPTPFSAGADRWLEISVKKPTDSTYTTLAPRQKITSVPYSLRSLLADLANNATNATNANNATNLGGQPASAYVLTTDTVTFIRNQTTPTQTANFRISGNGIASVFDASNEYRIGGSRVLGVTGSFNLFAGLGAGQSNNGSANAFVGANAGNANTSGSNNAFFGAGAGEKNTTAGSNTFIGFQSGFNNVTASENTFIGYQAGYSNNAIGLFSGTRNTFVGSRSGYSNSGSSTAATGSFNSFFGESAGYYNTTGSYNSYFGSYAGHDNDTGYDNSLFGFAAGQTLLGGSRNSAFGNNAGYYLNNSNLNSFFGFAAGFNNYGGDQNSFFGYNAGYNNFTGSNNTMIGSGADVGIDGLSFATAIGAGSRVSTINTIALGRPSGADVVVIYGLGAAGGTQLCRNGSNQIAACSSSLRYKTNIAPFASGLNFIRQLKPIAFDWKDGIQPRDVGFAAEDVEKINPLFVTYNSKGEVEGVKYDRLTTVLVNAVNEQQTQIEDQNKLINQQQQQIEEQRKQSVEQNQQIQSLIKENQSMREEIEKLKQWISQQQMRNRIQEVQIEELKKLFCSMNNKPEFCQQN
ncbi:MAG TPA: tail fiber domain-containing protein, partial [Pyrinomonadaceae bacterium]|nr:tail fiber domain-containing protein [Pyrinomonadaceae bacterium]